MASLLAFQTNLHTGAATWSSPIDLPPGPGGFAPQLALVYNSSIADEMRHTKGMAGWLGMGWNLAGLGSVRRADNRYYLTVGGVSDELVGPVPDGTAWAWHTKRESFYRIRSTVQDPEYQVGFFEVWDRGGTYYRFGGQTPAPSEQYGWLWEGDRSKPHSLMWYAHWEWTNASQSWTGRDARAACLTQTGHQRWWYDMAVRGLRPGVPKGLLPSGLSARHVTITSAGQAENEAYEPPLDGAATDIADAMSGRGG